ncbi:hypothetical protein SEVIR_8G027300v4 [Setaria viridis]|uniref:AT-hook motif nuclear-localized protein n=1 Tax=Setaria viridis TaxID=4556 RepID=A0A4U6TP35_SETVI|nr:AT-hook motif nuclear-localized protein 7-like [Setaria viridis]TKV99256.1 hypothetical protein SEVIR_8G027300v2 [Setaria viridis]
MEGREGVAVAGGHESGHGLFRADITMTEAQEAAKGYQSSPSPSTSPTSSPPPAEAGHGGDATATPLAWSLGGDKPSEAAGDNGMQTAGQSEQANLSSGRRRGRPRGSGRRQILATLGEWYAMSAGGSFTPHVIIVGTGEDVAGRIMSFSQKGPRSICILSANGSISNVTLRQPDSSGSTFTYEGRFEILQLMGSFTMAEEGRRRTGGLSVSLAGPDGRVVGGVVAGMLRAASPIQVIVGSFLPNSLKQHQRRMNLQQQASPAPALPAPVVPPPLLTAAMPISQAAPGNGYHGPPASAASPQPHATVEHGAMNLNTTGFTMVGWPASSPPMAHRASPDINVSLTPQE